MCLFQGCTRKRGSTSCTLPLFLLFPLHLFFLRVTKLQQFVVVVTEILVELWVRGCQACQRLTARVQKITHITCHPSPFSHTHLSFIFLLPFTFPAPFSTSLIQTVYASWTDEIFTHLTPHSPLPPLDLRLGMVAVSSATSTLKTHRNPRGIGWWALFRVLSGAPRRIWRLVFCLLVGG